jgi:hypothetical protein
MSKHVLASLGPDSHLEQSKSRKIGRNPRRTSTRSQAIYGRLVETCGPYPHELYELFSCDELNKFNLPQLDKK